jgi:hypothetical protein
LKTVVGKLDMSLLTKAEQFLLMVSGRHSSFPTPLR